MANCSNPALAQFITVEGQDGAGKTTNIEVIKSILNAHDIDFIQTREPGGTSLGEAIRELILNSDDSKFGHSAELLLMFAARAQHLEEVILPALNKGIWVLCDRFTDSTFAYQGGGRGLGIGKVAELEQLVQGDLRPNLTVLLDLPVEVGETRAGERSAADRFEQQQLEFKQRARETYLSIAAEQPERVKVVDANAPLEEVKAAVSNIMNEFVRSVKSIEAG